MILRVKKFGLMTLTLLLLSPNLVACRANYRVSKFSKCPPTDSKFLMLFVRSFEQCVEECKRRKSCGAIGLKRVYGLCELYTSSPPPDVDDNHCVMITRQDIDGEYGCEEWEVYETPAESGNHCASKECRPQGPLQNGKYLGNMNQVGSKKAIICNHGYVEKTNTESVECTSEGTWTYDAQCIDINECDSVPCDENHVCCNTVGSFTCEPLPVYTNDTFATNCPDENSEWVSLTCTEIQIRKLEKSQADAAAACRTDDAKLVKIDQKWKMDFIAKLLTDCNGFTGDYWVDGSNVNATDYSAADAWKFSDGSLVPMDSQYWNGYNSYYTDTHECVRIKASNYRFDDKICENELWFICEKERVW